MSEKYLVFKMAEEEYAIPLLSIRQVVGLQDATQVPFAPNYFKGIFNLRGQIISLIDLRMKLNLPIQETSESCVVICDLNPYVLGIIVDSVERVVTPEQEKLSEKPDSNSGIKTADFISNVYRETEEKLILFIDLFKVFNLEDKKVLNNIHQKAA